MYEYEYGFHFSLCRHKSKQTADATWQLSLSKYYSMRWHPVNPLYSSTILHSAYYTFKQPFPEFLATILKTTLISPALNSTIK